MSSTPASLPSFDRVAARGAVGAIIAYRRWISPHKGFSCAHQFVHGEGTCSAFGLDVFRTHGFRQAWALLRLRFQECKMAAHRIDEERSRRKREGGSRAKPARFCDTADKLECGCAAAEGCASPAVGGTKRLACAKLSALGECGACWP